MDKYLLDKNIEKVNKVIAICDKYNIVLSKQFREVLESYFIIKSDKLIEDHIDIIYVLQDLLDKFEKEFIKKKYNLEYYNQCKLFCTFIVGNGGNDAKELTSLLFEIYKLYFSKLNCLKSYNNTNNTIELNNPILFCKMIMVDNIRYKIIRVSPFCNKKQTSFVKVHFYEIFDKQIDIEIKDSDIVINVCKASGAGGQHVNKTSSKVQITHKCTGIRISCSDTRSQIKNREIAIQKLKTKIIETNKLQQMIEKKENYTHLFKISWANFDCIINLFKDNFVKDGRNNNKMRIKNIEYIDLYKLHYEYFYHCIQ